MPWIAIKDAVTSHGCTIQDTYQHISDLGLANSSARLLPERTVCLSRTASVGYVVVMGRSMATSQDFVNWVCGPALEADYLKYILLAERESLLRFASGTTHQTIYYPEAKAFHVLLPPLDEQRRILRILRALDDKIELNRRINESLEELARTIFKSWFLDFDPVRAKAHGERPVGLDAATEALFPSRLVNSELGEIPDGWEVKPFETAFAVPLRNGLTRPKAVRGHGTLMVNMGELFAYRRIGDIPMDRVPLSDQEADKFLLAPYDLLFARQSLTLEGAGQCALALPAREPRTYESHLIRCRIDPTKGDSLFWFHFFISGSGQQRVSSIVQQVAAAGIRGSDLARLAVTVPPLPLQEYFRDFIAPIELTIANNEEQSRVLAEVRDRLLPKLLSGALRLSAMDFLGEEEA